MQPHVLLVHPGASYSTHDVYAGYERALRRAGWKVTPYRLDARIEVASEWLKFCYSRTGTPGEPTAAEIQYRASSDVLERALCLGVDGVLVVSAMFLHPRAIKNLKAAHVNTAFLCTESPYDAGAETELLPWFDMVWTNERTTVAEMSEVHREVHYLPHSYDAECHYPRTVDASLPQHDVVFVGTGFPDRAEILRNTNWDGIDLGLYGVWEDVDLGDARTYLRDAVVDNAIATQLYANARIGLNLFRQACGPYPMMPEAARITTAESLNPRMYELAACEVFQISDWRPEVSEVFGPYVPTFERDNPASLEEVVRGWLALPVSRRAAALAARSRVQGCTFDDRVVQLSADLKRVWGVTEDELAPPVLTLVS